MPRLARFARELGVTQARWAGRVPGGAAKYSWFGPAMAVRAARDDLGRSSYRQDISAAAAIRR